MSRRLTVVERLTITLDDEYAEKLARLAERTHIQPGALAGSLLSTALDKVDADPDHAVELLDCIPGALDRAELGRTQADAQDGVPLDRL